MSDLWFGAKCRECGWIGSSQDCEGWCPIADTGDFSPVVCPECFKKEKEIEICDAEETELCNKIHSLEKRLEEAEGELAYVRQIAHGTLSNMIEEKTIEDSKELELHHYHRGQIENEWIKYFEKNPYRPAPTPGTETPDPEKE